jgi:hypothetical protein
MKPSIQLYMDKGFVSVHLHPFLANVMTGKSVGQVGCFCCRECVKHLLLADPYVPGYPDSYNLLHNTQQH